MEKDEEIIELIKEEILSLKFTLKYYGTKYLIESIYKTYCLNKLYDVNLTREVFPDLARVHNKSIDTIHSDIKKSINIMYYDCEEKIIEEYFYYDMIKKPTAKEIIVTVLEKIERKCNLEKGGKCERG